MNEYHERFAARALIVLLIGQALCFGINSVHAAYSLPLKLVSPLYQLGGSWVMAIIISFLL